MKNDLDFSTIYETHYQRVYSICLRMLKNESDAEDLAQESFVQIFRKLDGFRGDSKLSTWIHRLTVNTVLMYFRKHKRRRIVEIDIGDEEEGRLINQIPDPVRPRTVEKMDIKSALSQLPAGYKRVIVLHDVEGLEHQEIAAMTGVSAGTSKSQLHKARIRMRDLLKRKSNPRVWFPIVDKTPGVPVPRRLKAKDRRSLPRGVTHKNRGQVLAENKHSNYRQRLVQQGKCPHCGTPCAPYYECSNRRAKKRESYRRRMAA